jgi:hypothetical protein
LKGYIESISVAPPHTRGCGTALCASFKLVLCLGLQPHEGVPRAMDHHSSGCLPAEKFPAFASGRKGRGPVTLLARLSLLGLLTVRQGS